MLRILPAPCHRPSSISNKQLRNTGGIVGRYKLSLRRREGLKVKIKEALIKTVGKTSPYPKHRTSLDVVKPVG